MPTYERYRSMRGEISRSVVRGELRGRWIEDGKAFYFSRGGKNYKFSLSSKKIEEAEAIPLDSTRGHRNQSRRRPARGRQYTETFSPDEKLRAFYRDGNVFISDADGKNEFAVTTQGDVSKRIKYGTASWVFGEEIGVNEAMWWSPDGKKLAFYRIDETGVQDYYLTLNTIHIQNTLYTEAYPKAGAKNPVLDLFIYDLESKSTIQVDVRDGLPFTNDVLGHYVYNVQWSPNGKELLFHRTNRRQNIMEFCASEPNTGKVRTIIREEWLNSWTENHPPLRWLDEQRFLWISERNGFRNIYLGNIKNGIERTITKHNFEVNNIVHVDGSAGWIWYTARSGDNPYKIQLHRVDFQGDNDKRLTDPKFHHEINLAPGGKHFVDIFQTHKDPPATQIVDENGNVVEVLEKSDLTKFSELQLKRIEMFTYTAADGKTTCYGILHKPSNFDENKKYPLLVSVYAGPESNSISERFATPDPVTELGFLVATFDGRGTSGRGKAHKDEVYMKLGQIEIDDQAAGVKHLASRPYVDASRVGIHGTSYGGYAAIMCLLRYPDVFQAACGSSSVTAWENYDTIYTERYMWIPQENKEGYEKGSAMTYVRNLRGDLMIFWGTADDNVHPSNSHQLIRALNSAGKFYEVQIGPDAGHAGIPFERMMEFFVDRLIVRPQMQGGVAK